MEIMIAVNDNEDGTSTANKALLAEAEVGQVLEVYGLNIASRTLGVAPYIKLAGAGEVTPEKPTPTATPAFWQTC